MNVMETKEINNVSEMIQGCNEAMINYALTEDMRLVRMVTFYNSNDSDSEHICSSMAEICKRQGNISICKALMYKILSLTKVVKRGINYHAILFKDIPGYTPDPDLTSDCRTHNTYKK